MKLFNIDLHISVIADVKKILENLGHEVNSKCLSNHTFLLGKQPDSIDIISQQNWKHIDKNMCDQFYMRYKDELADYDAFICTYPPSFSLLYEKFNKPIIIQVPIRFEAPFENDPSKLNWFIDFLKSGIDNKQIIPMCNSLYEKKYCERFTDREWNLIPNICDYTNIDYDHTGSKFILYSKKNIIIDNVNIINKEKYAPRPYNWSIFNKVKGIIHMPYNISTMSIFEHYTGNIPLLFPTPEFCVELSKDDTTLSEISWTENKLNSLDWVKYADYYNNEWMPYITYFSSFKELNEVIETIDTNYISNKMRSFNLIRKQKIVNLWKETLEDIL